MKMEKTVRKGKIRYGVIVYLDEENSPYRVEAWWAEYPLSGYGNNYGTSYDIDLAYSNRWAKVEVNCWNATGATRGHGMTDSWTEAEDYVNHKEAREFVEEVLEESNEAEDGTPDVLDIYEKVRSFVIDNIEDYEEWDY